LEEPKTIGLSGLVAKILCRKHNSHLSGLDETALDTFDAFRESVRLNKVRTGLRAKSWRNKLFVIDGARLERWFLKTLINLSVGSEWIVGSRSSSRRDAIGTPREGRFWNGAV
jgi:hypothetical protein